MLSKMRSKIMCFLEHRFGRALGKVLGDQKLRFSHFFRCFFDAKFGLQLGRAKNRKKKPPSNRFPLLGAGSAVIPRLLGEKKRGVQEPYNPLELAIRSLAICDRSGALVDSDVVVV